MQMTQKGAILAIMPVSMSQVEFEGTKEVIRIRKSMTKQHNCQKKKDKMTKRSMKYYTEN